MKKIRCPHCEQKSIPLLKKMNTGPAGIIKCEICGKESSISWKSHWLTFSPILIAPFFSHFINPFWVWILFYLFIGVSGLSILTFCIPLEKR